MPAHYSDSLPRYPKNGNDNYTIHKIKQKHLKGVYRTYTVCEHGIASHDPHCEVNITVVSNIAPEDCVPGKLFKSYADIWRWAQRTVQNSVLDRFYPPTR